MSYPQQQYPQPQYQPQQYPQQPMYAPAPYPSQPMYGPGPAPQQPRAKSSKTVIAIIVAVVVTIVVVIAVIAVVFLMGSSLVGRWNILYTESSGIRTDASSGQYIEFRSGGTGTISGPLTGSSSVSMDFEWKDMGNHEVDLTYTVMGLKVTMPYSYTISGNMLTLHLSYGGLSSSTVCQKA